MDSNVLIYYVALLLPQAGNDFVEYIFNTDFLISVAVKIEVLGYNDVPHKMRTMEEFVDAATVLPLDDIVTQQTIELRRLHKKLKLGDAIIAATAVVHNLTLISRNLADFRNIKGLSVIDSHSL